MCAEWCCLYDPLFWSRWWHETHFSWVIIFFINSYLVFYKFSYPVIMHNWEQMYRKDPHSELVKMISFQLVSNKHWQLSY
jgi:hypothetical protein